MRDLWGFLLQTLTVSGAAVLVLVVKTLLCRQLSPRWQAGIWGLVGIVALLPAGWGGRYVLVNWPAAVETLKAVLAGDYGPLGVIAPIPLPNAAPQTVWQWLFWVYAVGAGGCLLWYLIAYVRLRLALRRGTPAAADVTAAVEKTAAQYGLSACPAVEVEGISSAFICGVVRPVLAVPAGCAMDEKVILHELLHYRYHDVAWGMGICLVRCLHWCNPLMQYCANRAGNDLEALCDQRVLERLEGEERRDYGRILLSMADEAYARAPGTSSIANGGANIRRRIQAIARFKRYPAGMALVSVCMSVVLAAPLVVGSRAHGVYLGEHYLPGTLDMEVALATGRTTWCTTAAGALDSYGKALLTESGVLRAMCAPQAQQADLAAGVLQRERAGIQPEWETGLPCPADQTQGYFLYNLRQLGPEVYEGLMVVVLSYPPDGQPAEENCLDIAVQTVQAQKEDGRWVVVPQEAFQVVRAREPALLWGCSELPGIDYTGKVGDLEIGVSYQTITEVDNAVTQSSWLGSTMSFDLTPKPGAVFDEVRDMQWGTCTYTGAEAQKNSITRLGFSVAPMWERDEEPPTLRSVNGYSSGSSSDGTAWGSLSLEPGWGPTVRIFAGGSGGTYNPACPVPEAFWADLYCNGERLTGPPVVLEKEGTA